MNRQKLKELIYHINKARELIAGESAPDKQTINFNLLKQGLQEADCICLEMWEDGRIRCGDDKEPLDSKEEAFYHDLKSHLVKGRYLLTEDQFNSLTHAQKFSAARVMARNLPPEGVFLTDHLGLRFPHIYIGIEEDGYAHS